MTRYRYVIEKKVARFVTPDRHYVIRQFDSSARLWSRSNHEFVTVFTQWTAIRIGMHLVGRANNRNRNRLRRGCFVLWSTTRPTKVRVGVEYLSTATAVHVLHTSEEWKMPSG
jgi:hypothetical protein